MRNIHLRSASGGAKGGPPTTRRPSPPADPMRAAFEAMLAASSRDVIVVADERLRIVRAGMAAAELSGRSVAELPGMSLIAAFGSVALDALAREAIQSRLAQADDISLGQPDLRHFHVDAIPTDAGLVLLMRDVTAVRRLERVRRDLIANLGHELRTPLSAVKLLAETLSSGAADDPATAQDFARQIEREVDHLAELVAELQELSIIESGEIRLSLEEVEPDRLIGDALERMRPLAERRGMTLLAVGGPSGSRPMARVDAPRIGQALVNLIHNAVKFSRPGGEIRVGWKPSGEYVRLMVADDGIGIPAAHLSRVFERFYKVDRSRARDAEPTDDGWRSGSAGLGLAIVRHIAVAHDGRADVESREDVGSTFWIDVPAIR